MEEKDKYAQLSEYIIQQSDEIIDGKFLFTEDTIDKIARYILDREPEPAKERLFTFNDVEYIREPKASENVCKNKQGVLCGLFYYDCPLEHCGNDILIPKIKLYEK